MCPLLEPSNKDERRREDRNRKQREYRARRKCNETNDEREARNKRQLDYRSRKKVESGTWCRASTYILYRILNYCLAIIHHPLVGITNSAVHDQSPYGTDRNNKLSPYSQLEGTGNLKTML
jgi:hypothetical protein